MSAAVAAQSRLERLLGYLDQDPGNLSLVANAAEAALDEGNPKTAWALVDRYAAAAELTPQLRNLKGLTALTLGDFTAAAAIFEPLALENPQDTALRFNLAWARAQLDDHEGVLAALGDDVLAAVPSAPTLKIHAFHHLDRLDEALACGALLAELHPGDTALMGALATAAIDAEDLELAKRYAIAAGDDPDGLAAAGVAMLDDSDIDGAMAVFDRALAAEPDNPRAALGKGLALLANEMPAEGARWLDQGAEAFETHLGSWVASAWAYFTMGDLETSRKRFETALGIDDTFAEIHGGLAVLDIVNNDLDSARKRTEVALRLDRQCFAGALAKSMLLTAEGDRAAAVRIEEIALRTPIGRRGKTIAQVLGTMAGGRRR